jgi:hypothetical protein
MLYFGSGSSIENCRLICHPISLRATLATIRMRKEAIGKQFVATQSASNKKREFIGF